MGRRRACSRRSISACRLDTVSMRRWRSRWAALLLPSRLQSALCHLGSPPSCSTATQWLPVAMSFLKSKGQLAPFRLSIVWAGFKAEST